MISFSAASSDNQFGRSGFPLAGLPLSEEEFLLPNKPNPLRESDEDDEGTVSLSTLFFLQQGEYGSSCGRRQAKTIMRAYRTIAIMENSPPFPTTHGS